MGLDGNSFLWEFAANSGAPNAGAQFTTESSPGNYTTDKSNVRLLYINYSSPTNTGNQYEEWMKNMKKNDIIYIRNRDNDLPRDFVHYKIRNDEDIVFNTNYAIFPVENLTINPPYTNLIAGDQYSIGYVSSGTIGFDGNSSMWKWSNNPIALGSGKFTTLTGAWGNSLTNFDQKDQITGIRIRHQDNVAVTPNLLQWLLFCNVGSILYIRRVDKVQEVAYYEVTNVINYGLNMVRYLVNYIDGDGTPSAGIPFENTYINDEQYYIGYIPSNTLPPANAVTFISAGEEAVSTPTTVTIPSPRQFSFNVFTPTSPGVEPGWDDVDKIYVSTEDSNGVDVKRWLSGARPGGILTVRQKGNKNNFAHYKLATAFTQVGTTAIFVADFFLLGSNTYVLSYGNEGVGIPYDGASPTNLPPSAQSGWIVADDPGDTNSNPNTNPPTYPITLNYEYEISYSNVGERGPQGPLGQTGPPGPGGSSGGGAVGVSFSMELTGSPTQWSNNSPPTNIVVDPMGPYILYTGEDSNNNNIMPFFPKNFEFIHLEGNSWAGAPVPSPGDFPIVDHIQQNNIFTTPINGHKLPQLGPQPGTQNFYNNFYGFRVPQDGQMVGFQINYIQKPMTGQFYAMYYSPNSGQPRVIFNKGGPLVGNMNSSGPFSMAFASGNSIWDPSVSIPVKADGFIFVVSDLSFRSPNGVYSSNWNNLGPGGSGIPFRPPSGKIHATVYLTYD